MSQLRILKEYLHRLEMDQGGSLQRISEHFDLIVGSGGGGQVVIAILLGVLGMDLDQASLAFSRICKATLLGDARSLTQEERTQRLGGVIKQILGESKVPEDCAFNSKVGLASECKVAILYQSAAHLGQCNLFRNYDSRHLALNATIMQVMLAAWATPTLFSSVKIEDDIGREEVVSAAGACSNPIFEAICEAHTTCGPNRMVSCILSLGSGSQSSWSAEVKYKTSIVQYAREAMGIAEDAQRRLGTSGVYFRLAVTPAIEDNQATLEDALGVIASSTSHYLSLAYQDGLVDGCITKATEAGSVELESLLQVRGGRTTARHGLPPLSPFFVTRKELTSRIYGGIVQGSGQTIVVLSGMGGSGKTQLSIEFALRYGELFQHVLFIDASSEKASKLDLYQQAMGLLEEPAGKLTSRWLIIFDNADDENFSVHNYIPNCGHGSILITTRNPSLGNLAPESHIALDIMSVEEATNALFASAMNANEEKTARHIETAQKIVEQLGYLPIAIVQAGGYIRKQRCFWDYLRRLETNRANLLRHYTVQRDRLKYKHGVYAAFDTTLGVLSSRALHLLSMLSCMHFANIPRQMFLLAATHGFDHQAYDLSPPPDSFQGSVSLLRETLTPSGNKLLSESELDELLDELFQYSLVSYVPYYSTVTIHLHPLLHSWAGDRLTAEQRPRYRAATARLIGSCFHRTKVDLLGELYPHVSALLPFLSDFHLNERAGLCRSIKWGGKFTLQRQIWEEIHVEVQKVHGEKDIRTSAAALFLASAYGDEGNATMMEEMERSIVAKRSMLYGPGSLEATEALHHLALTLLLDKREFKEAEEAVLRVLAARRHILGPLHVDIYSALNTLGQVYYQSKRYSEAASTFLQAREMYMALHGRNHDPTINTPWLLASCYYAPQNPAAREIVREYSDTLERSLADRLLTLSTLYWLGEISYKMAEYEQAEKFCRRELEMMSEQVKYQGDLKIPRVYLPEMPGLGLGHLTGEKTMKGQARSWGTPHHLAWTSQIKMNLGKAIYMQHPRSSEAENYFKEAIASARELDDSLIDERLRLVSVGLVWLATVLINRSDYALAVEILEECISVGSHLTQMEAATAVDHATLSYATDLLATTRGSLERLK
ncbi:SubName: Full=Uncharacterized protein {ECO:0000313/EMBL:CCA75861.1} [Serendipita indica DSM 11827]|nr:SubName: Full=Uncharacterized protein {ECO:0000313/EMBL:CCA75861.1} [Serendipita indica DSM 11827]